MSSLENQYFDLLKKYQELKEKYVELKNKYEKYECEFCGKYFTTMASLRRHQKRSKICKKIRSLPRLNYSPEQQIENAGGILCLSD